MIRALLIDLVMLAILAAVFTAVFVVGDLIVYGKVNW